MKTCVKCSSELPESAVHCVFCGAKQPEAPAPAPSGAVAKTMMGQPGMAEELARRANELAPPRAPTPAPVLTDPAQMGIAETLASPKLDVQPLAQPAFSVRPDNLPPASSETPPPARRLGPHAGPGAGPYQAPANSAPHARTMGMSPDAQISAPPAMPADQSGPVPGGFAPPPAYGGPPPGMGGMGGPAPQMPGPPPGMGGGAVPAMGGPPGVSGPPGMVPVRNAGAHRPPHLAANSAPIEPWAHSIKTLMLVFGVLLIACFVAPWSVAGGNTVFSWSLLKGGDLLPKLTPLLMAGTGLLAIVFALTPLGVVGRGFAALAFGALAIVGVPTFAFVKAGFSVPALLALLYVVIGFFTMIPGLLLRSQYRSSLLARILVTLGALSMIAPYVVPTAGGNIPIAGMFSAFSGGAAAIVSGVMLLLPLAIAAFALIMAWIPAPNSGLGGVFAWILILMPLLVSISILAVQGSAMFDALKRSLAGAIYLPLSQSAWLAFGGYGMASLLGKKLES